MNLFSVRQQSANQSVRAAENQSVVEKVVYTPSIEHPGQTVAVRSAWIDSQVFGFSRAIRAFGVERFKKNCNKMVSIVYYWFVDNLLNYLVQWRWFELLRSYLSTFSLTIQILQIINRRTFTPIM